MHPSAKEPIEGLCKDKSKLGRCFKQTSQICYRVTFAAHDHLVATHYARWCLIELWPKPKQSTSDKTIAITASIVILFSTHHSFFFLVFLCVFSQKLGTLASCPGTSLPFIRKERWLVTEFTEIWKPFETTIYWRWQDRELDFKSEQSCWSTMFITYEH